MTDTANWLDRAIGWVAPERGLRRVLARQAGLRVRGYEAAKGGRRTDGWWAPNTGPNAEIGPAAQRLRARSRDLARNDPIATNIVRTHVSHIVGAGIVPRLSIPADDANPDRRLAAIRRHREDWKSFSRQADPQGQLNWYGLQALVCRTVIESGEALVLVLPRPRAFGLEVPLQLQVLEPDFLDSSRLAPNTAGNLVVQGIELDRDGRRAGYWLYDQHPGESYLGMNMGQQSRFWPADQVLHVFDVLRPGQLRGVPWLAPVVMTLRDTGDYVDAEIVRKRIEACIAAFVSRAEDLGGEGVGGAGNTVTDSAGKIVEKMAPGMIAYLPGESNVSFNTPSASEGYADFLRTQHRIAAVGAGIPYEDAAGDLSQVNYSSYRGGRLNYWAKLDQWQWNMMIHQLCEPVERALDTLLVAMGRRPQSERSIWTPPERPLIDPGKDGLANTHLMRSGQRSLPAIIAATGEDPEEVLAEIRDFNRLVDAYGVVLDSDPRKTADSGALQAVLTAEAQQQKGTQNAA